MKIVGYLPTSLLEWPGQIASVIFTPNCNLRCPFCHNPDLVNWQPGHSPLIEPKTILKDLLDRRSWIDGLVVSGGEPTLQPGLADFLTSVKKNGSTVMVETNGTRPEVVKELVKKRVVDFWALDYKISWESYDRLTDKNGDPKLGQKVIQSLKEIIGSRSGFELRTTVVPTLHNKTELVKMGRALNRIGGSEWEKRGGWLLQSFRPQRCLDARFEKIKPMLVPVQKEWLLAVKKIVPMVTWKGLE